MKKTLYVDITDFSSWKGHFSGIQRVVYEVGVRLANHKDFEIRYVYYSARSRKFFTVDTDIFKQTQVNRQQQLRVSQDQPSIGGRSLVGTGKDIAKATYRRLPTPARKAVKKTYNYTRHHAGVVFNRSIRPTLRSLKHRYVHGRTPKYLRGRKTPLVIGPNDTFAIFGQGWYQYTMPRELAKLKARHGFKLAVLIHDIIPVIHPETFDKGFANVYNEFLFETFVMADTIFAISQSTKRDIEAYCTTNNIPTPAIAVVREGDSFSDAHASRPAQITEKEAFILAVGSFEVRKNYQLLYQVAKQAQLSKKRIPKIVIVGRKGYLSHNLTSLIEGDFSIKDSLVHLSNASDSELQWLYEHALFTVYPSIYEGWGLPIAESLYHGKFCITSSTSSMPEVGGSLTDTLSPYDVAAWLDAIHRYATDTTLLEKKTAAIKRNYKPTTWNETVSAIAPHLR